MFSIFQLINGIYRYLYWTIFRGRTFGEVPLVLNVGFREIKLDQHKHSLRADQGGGEEQKGLEVTKKVLTADFLESRFIELHKKARIKSKLSPAALGVVSDSQSSSSLTSSLHTLCAPVYKLLCWIIKCELEIEDEPDFTYVPEASAQQWIAELDVVVMQEFDDPQLHIVGDIVVYRILCAFKNASIDSESALRKLLSEGTDVNDLVKTKLKLSDMYVPVLQKFFQKVTGRSQLPEDTKIPGHDNELHPEGIFFTPSEGTDVKAKLEKNYVPVLRNFFQKITNRSQPPVTTLIPGHDKELHPEGIFFTEIDP